MVRESYTRPIGPGGPQTPTRPVPIVQIGSRITGTGATYLLDYDDPIMEQWLAEKWLDWTLDVFYIPPGPYEGEIASNEYAFIIRAWAWINSNIGYDLDALDIGWRNRKASNILDRGYGVCADINILFVTMLRFAGINSRYIEGRKEGAIDYHAWTQVKIGGAWFNIDPLLTANPNFVSDDYGSTFDDYIAAILGSDTNTNDPYYGEDVEQFFEELS